MNTDEHHSDNDCPIRVEAEFPQKDVYGCNFDDSLGIESIKSDKDKQSGEHLSCKVRDCIGYQASELE